MTTRIYIIMPKKTEHPVKPRLVRAANSAQALRHVANDLQVVLASQDDLVRAIGDGVAVEQAKVGANDVP
jgi:hypothetical protein